MSENALKSEASELEIATSTIAHHGEQLDELTSLIRSAVPVHRMPGVDYTDVQRNFKFNGPEADFVAQIRTGLEILVANDTSASLQLGIASFLLDIASQREKTLLFQLKGGCAGRRQFELQTNNPVFSRLAPDEQALLNSVAQAHRAAHSAASRRGGKRGDKPTRGQPPSQARQSGAA